MLGANSSPHGEDGANHENDLTLVPDFAFQLGKERLNWQILAAIDIHRVVREVDIDTLQVTK